MAKLRQVEVLVGKHQTVTDGVRVIGVTEAAYYRWRSEFRGLKLDSVRRLKQLAQANAQLRRAVPDLRLEKLVLKEATTEIIERDASSGGVRLWRTSWRF